MKLLENVYFWIVTTVLASIPAALLGIWIGKAIDF